MEKENNIDLKKYGKIIFICISSIFLLYILYRLISFVVVIKFIFECFKLLYMFAR